MFVCEVGREGSMKMSNKNGVVKTVMAIRLI